jgi:TATA-binding protein-associated factor
VQAARYSKKGSREADAGLLALDALHKQVMPFVLRRTKQQVLSDLPPKIITDISCELTPFQRQLYEDFSSSQALSEVAGALKGSAAGEGSGGGPRGAGEKEKVPGNVLSALMYLRKLCSHPAMALDWQVRGLWAAWASLVADCKYAQLMDRRCREHARKAGVDNIVGCLLFLP